MINQNYFEEVVQRLYATVQELETMFPGRHFTPDGHMVGSLGECLVADAYGLELETASNKGFDAVSPNGIEVEIKATQGKTVAFRSQPEHAIVILILPDGTFEEIYNGPGDRIWGLFEGKRLPSNGQHQVSFTKCPEARELKKKPPERQGARNWHSVARKLEDSESLGRFLDRFRTVPCLNGEVMVTLNIAADGHVSEVSLIESTIRSDEFSRMLVDEMYRLSFEEIDDVGPSIVPFKISLGK